MAASVVTNQTLAPKDKFFQLLSPTLEKEHYQFQKSKNGFVQSFDLGKRELTASFITTGGVIYDVQFFLHIIFKEVEKIFNKAVPNYGWTNWTISRNLGCIGKGLYDEDAARHTDEAIAAAAEAFYEGVKPEANKVINRFNSYTYLEEQLNAHPGERFGYCGRTDKRVINGLILRKYLRKDLPYEKLKADYLKNFDKHEDFNKQYVLQAIEYIETHEHSL